MAQLDPRVRSLTDLLMRQGFSWIVAEIIAVVEAGVPQISDEDGDVAGQRLRLDERARGAFSSEGYKEYIKSFRPTERRVESYPPDEQVRVAVDIFLERLVGAGDMFQNSQLALNSVMNTQVPIVIEYLDEIRFTDYVALRTTIEGLRESRSEILEWLLTGQK